MDSDGVIVVAAIVGVVGRRAWEEIFIVRGDFVSGAEDDVVAMSGGCGPNRWPRCRSDGGACGIIPTTSLSPQPVSREKRPHILDNRDMIDGVGAEGRMVREVAICSHRRCSIIPITR